jgi:peptide/nickel transport system permease protein
MGRSLATRQPVSSLIADRIVNSLTLLVFALAISIPLSGAIGAATAIRRDRLFDNTTQVVTLVLTALPDFVIAMTLVVVFATTVLTVLPSVALIPPGESALSHPRVLILPVATLVLAVVPYLSRLARASIIDVLESEYVQMARLKGLRERRILIGHALPNALVPGIQASALSVAYLLGGIVVVEYVFRYPGLGSALTDAVANRDLAVIQAVVLVMAATVILANLVADVLTVLVTPRLRTGGG